MESKNNITGNAVASNLIWRLAERWGAQGVSFVVSIVLARFLMPEDYGLIAIVTVITSILNVFIDSGMANALIQKKDADDLDFSTVFYFNTTFCIILYLGLFAAAPWVGRLYHSATLVSVLRVLGLTLVIAGVKNTQMSYVSKTMQFRRFFFATLGGTITAAVVGIVMASHGYGVWALVVQQLVNSTMDTVILWMTVRWRPKMMFSLSRLKKLVSFGWKMLASNLLDTVYNNIRTLIIGVMYSSADLGLYNKGKSFPWLIVENINSSINSVLLPAMSSKQDDTEQLKNMTRQSIRVSSYTMAPLMMGLFFVATPLISMLLTEKWLPCIPFMRVFCVTYMFYPIHTANLNAILAKGRSDIFLKLEVLKKVIGIMALVISMNISVMAMAYSLLVTTVFSMLINSWPNRKLINYTLWEQIKDIFPSIGLAIIMGFCVSLVELLHLPSAATLLIQVPMGAAIYIGASAVLHLESYEYLMRMVCPILKRLARK